MVVGGRRDLDGSETDGYTGWYPRGCGKVVLYVFFWLCGMVTFWMGWRRLSSRKDHVCHPRKTIPSAEGAIVDGTFLDIQHACFSFDHPTHYIPIFTTIFYGNPKGYYNKAHMYHKVMVTHPRYQLLGRLAALIFAGVGESTHVHENGSTHTHTI